MSDSRGVLSVVGIGPGSAPHTSPAALEAITSADVVVGYITYIKLVRHLTEGKEIIRTGMTEEIGRARAAGSGLSPVARASPANGSGSRATARNRSPPGSPCPRP